METIEQLNNIKKRNADYKNNKTSNSSQIRSNNHKLNTKKTLNGTKKIHKNTKIYKDSETNLTSGIASSLQTSDARKSQNSNKINRTSIYTKP